MKRFLRLSVVFLLIVLLAVPAKAMANSMNTMANIGCSLESFENYDSSCGQTFGDANKYSYEQIAWDGSGDKSGGGSGDGAGGGSGGESGGGSGGESGDGSGGESGDGSENNSDGGSGGESGGGSGEGPGEGPGDGSGEGSGNGSGDGSVTPNEPTEGNSNMDGNSGSGNNKKGNSGSGKHAGAAAEDSPALTEESETSAPTTVPVTEETTAATTETIVQITSDEKGDSDLTPLLFLLIALIAAALVLIFILLKKLKESKEQTIQNPPIHTAHTDIEETALNAAPPSRPQASAPAEPTVYTAVMPAKPVVVTKSPKAPSTVLQDAVADTEVAAPVAAATAATAAVPVYYLVGQTGHFAGQRFPISKQIRFGRGGINDIAYPLDASGISGVHCALIPGKDGVILVDLGSTYGTHLPNGTKLNPNHNYLMKRGDSFCLCNKKESFRIE